MSIEIVAPSKYRFQDLVCVDLALQNWDSPDCELFIEPKDGEDALFVRKRADGTFDRFEIQVKGSSNAVDIESIASCLAHCPRSASAPSLFERLYENVSTGALLVMSGRCTDESLPFLLSNDLTFPEPRPEGVRLSDAAKLISVYEALPVASSSKLDGDRQIARIALVQRMNPQKKRDATSRVFVGEQRTELALRASCREKLITEHRVPFESVEIVLTALCEVVANAKTTRGDALPGLRQAMQHFSPDPLRPTNYILRSDESGWLAEVLSANALLLSGPPRCGKTDAGRYIAGECQRLGYEIRIGADVEEAKRFLSDLGQSKRVFLLDDPLGGTRVDSDATRSMSTLRGLLRQLSPTRKIIVCQNQYQLFFVLSTTSLAECSLEAHKWFNLGDRNEAFLLKVWSQLSKETGLAPRIIDAVSGLIEKGSGQLEVGALRHLAYVSGSIDVAASEDLLLRKALEDASDLGRELVDRRPAMRDVLLALSVGSAPLRPINQTEVAFAISNDSTLYGKRDSESHTVFGPFDEASEFPTYANPPALTEEQRLALEDIERLRFIQRTAPSLSFTHPFYRAAAESLVKGATPLMAERALQITEKNLFSIARNTSTSAARALDWLFETLTGDESRVLITKLAVAGMDSIFPATCDLCLSFLLRRRDEIASDFARKLPSWIDSVLSVDLGRVRWHHGEAWIPEGGLSMFDSMTNEYAQPEDIDGFLVRLLTDDHLLPSAEEAAKALNGFKQNPLALTDRAAIRLLAYDESLLRSQTAKLWLSVNRHADDVLLDYLFEDAHPRILLGIYSGLLQGWPEFTLARRRSVLARLNKLASDQYLAPTLLPRLAVFDRIEYTGPNPPWEVFSSLLPVVLQSLPRLAKFDGARLFSATEAATHALPPDEIVTILTAWINWLVRETQWRLPNDFELGVADLLFRGTKTNASARNGLVERLLSFPQTGPVLCFLKDMVDYWATLTKSEKQVVLSLLTSERSDVTWLQAVALTRSDVPAEIQSKILGDEQFLSKSPNQIVADMPPALLQHSVCTYVGYPSELWWLGTQGSSSNGFAKVVDFLLTQPDHSLFETALWRALISPVDDKIQQVVKNAGSSHAERLFSYFLAYKVRCTGKWLPKTWEELLRQMTSLGLRDYALGQMAKYAPAILDELADLRDWFSNNTDRKDLLMRLPNDAATAMTAFKILDARKAGLAVDQLIAQLRSQIEGGDTPVLYGTYDLLREAIKGLNSTSDIESGLSLLRSNVFEVKGKLEKELREPDDEISGWMRYTADDSFEISE